MHSGAYARAFPVHEKPARDGRHVPGKRRCRRGWENPQAAYRYKTALSLPLPGTAPFAKHTLRYRAVNPAYAPVMVNTNTVNAEFACSKLVAFDEKFPNSPPVRRIQNYG